MTLAENHRRILKIKAICLPEFIIVSFVLVNAFSALFRLVHNLGVARTEVIEIISHIDNIQFTQPVPAGKREDICGLPVNVHTDLKTKQVPISLRENLLTTSYSQALEPTYFFDSDLYDCSRQVDGRKLDEFMRAFYLVEDDLMVDDENSLKNKKIGQNSSLIMDTTPLDIKTSDFHLIRIGCFTFNIIHYVSVLSVARFSKSSSTIYIHTDCPSLVKEPDFIRLNEEVNKKSYSHLGGTNPQKIKVIRILKNVLENAMGVTIIRKEHQSDRYRLLLLLKYGGVYMDNDIWMIRTLDDWFKMPTLVELDSPRNTLSNAFILAPTPNSLFLRKWLDGYSSYSSEEELIDFTKWKRMVKKMVHRGGKTGFTKSSKSQSSHHHKSSKPKKSKVDLYQRDRKLINSIKTSPSNLTKFKHDNFRKISRVFRQTKKGHNTQPDGDVGSGIDWKTYQPTYYYWYKYSMRLPWIIWTSPKETVNYHEVKVLTHGEFVRPGQFIVNQELLWNWHDNYNVHISDRTLGKKYKYRNYTYPLLTLKDFYCLPDTSFGEIARYVIFNADLAEI